jgi:ketosteroid isomerase-like protein
MSRESVEFLRQDYEALQRGDTETFKALSRERLDPEFAFHHVLRRSARGGGGRVPVAQELAVVWTFEGDRAVRARSFTSRAEALEAAGLRE